MNRSAVFAIAATVVALFLLGFIAFCTYKMAGQCYHAFLPKVHAPINYCPGQLRNR